MHEISPWSLVGIAASNNGVSKPRAAKIPRRWRWHWQTLMKLRERLIGERAQHLSEAAQPMECHSTHMADSASEELDRALALSCLSTEQNELYEVEAALQQITNGTYGICEKTGTRIPAARLQAIPWTRFSREVQTQREMSSQRRGRSTVCAAVRHRHRIL